MIVTKLSDESILKQKSECLVVMLEEKFTFSKQLQEIAKEVFPQLEDLFAHHKFTGSLSSTVVVPAIINKKIVNCIFIGLGKAGVNKTIDIENYRRALGNVVKQAAALKVESLALTLPAAKIFGVSVEYLAKQTAIIMNMAAYQFTEFWTDTERKGVELVQVTLCVSSADKKVVQHGVDEGNVVAHAVNKTRHWIDMPPSSMTPEHLADEAQKIAKKHTDLKLTIFSEKEINKMGMGGLAAVSRGSDLDCKLVILEYKTTKKGAPTIAFVGKGITFDSGGLSIKPADSMESMKDDMSGAAAVIAAMEALAILKPDVNVIGVAPIAENLPSGNAVKPGDIVRFYNGKTAEIKNTDAEGRLILADALAYTVKHYKPDAIMDIATLTGACAYFLGPYFTGLMSKHDDFVGRVQEAADISGDRVWRLPMHEDYKPAIVTAVADLSNTGSSRIKSGAITAAWFLSHFVGDVPWVHLDIAGTAFDVPDIPYYRSGATGAGVRLMVELAMNWKK
ncbi:MAG: leucyl aminopeptidase [Candidatus Dependentiae bacterium]|nr:leucyl aminopeptidase [Candidatus Dependentiae bacterium]